MAVVNFEKGPTGRDVPVGRTKQYSALACAMLLTAAFLASPLQAGEMQDYNLGIGDVVGLTVLEKPEISGNYRVAPDGTFTIPGFGAVEASGLTARQLEKRITELSQATINAPSVAVQIVEFRPFYILGDVARPGKYSYVPGVNVLQTISLAEGYFRRGADSTDFSQVLADIRARQGLSSAVADLAAAKVKLERLIAEQGDKDKFEFDANAFGPSMRQTVDAITKEEMATLQLKTKAFQEQKALLEEGISGRLKEQETYNERLKSQANLVAQLADELKQTRELQKQGLTTTARLNDLIREELRQQSDVIQTRILVQQVAVAISTDRQSLSFLANARRVAIAEDIRATQDRITQLQKQIEGEKAVINETSSVLTGNGTSQEPSYEYEILRANEAVPFMAEVTAPVLPGDTLIVRRRALDLSPEKTSATK
jgi:protein involved in polysaccharide export with SLBB domain